MGDSRRNSIFASFIKRNYKVSSVLVVADGKGELASELLKQGFSVRVIENKPRFQGHLPKGLKYTKGWFTEDSPVFEDIIVGMHPDEATSEIVLAAKKNKKKFAVVPCCVVGRFSDGITHSQQWHSRLRSLYGGARETTLPFGGKNTVIFS